VQNFIPQLTQPVRCRSQMTMRATMQDLLQGKKRGGNLDAATGLCKLAHESFE
jgi:hypothetical protein